MFSVIISEKGGAERRETFERTEINVGRVQGNELMLPKGNVSKRHARLLFRDGRFIVTDLKSTNGTYVNGRKIAQATIVREGDKIYIGDFVLRIEQVSSQGPPSPAASEDQAAATGEINQPHKSGGSHPTLGGENFGSWLRFDSRRRGASVPARGPRDVAERASRFSVVRLSVLRGAFVARPSPRIEPKNDPGRDVISHFPLEHDPDDSVPYAVPGPPKVPNTPAPNQRVGASQPPGRAGDPTSSPVPEQRQRADQQAQILGAAARRPSSPGNTQQNASNFMQSVIPGPQTIAAPAPSGSSSPDARCLLSSTASSASHGHRRTPRAAPPATAWSPRFGAIRASPPGVAPDADQHRPHRADLERSRRRDEVARRTARRRRPRDVGARRAPRAHRARPAHAAPRGRRRRPRSR